MTSPQSSRSKDSVHLPLAARLLPISPGDPLPPITDRASAQLSPLDQRIYHLLALSLRAYVASWYSTRLSPRERTLIPFIHSTLLHPLLPPLLRQIPAALPALILVDIPTIIALHIQTYRQASKAIEYTHDYSIDSSSSSSSSSSSALLSGSSTSPTSVPSAFSLRLGAAYHARLPLLSCVPYSPNPTPTTTSTSFIDPTTTRSRTEPKLGQYALNPTYLTAMADALLRLYLPSKEYASDAERIIVREIIGQTILWSTGRRLSQPWFWHGIILHFIQPKVKKEEKKSNTTFTEIAQTPKTNTNIDTKETTSAPGATSSTQINTTTMTSPRPLFNIDRMKTLLITYQTFLTGLFTQIWSFLILFWNAATWALSTPPSSGPQAIVEPWVSVIKGFVGAPTWASRIIWGVLDMILIVFGPILDRVIPILFDRLTTEHTALQATNLVERIMFPNDGYPGPSPIDPTPEEAAQLRLALVERLEIITPKWIRVIFFPTGIEKMIEPLDDPGCNAHLIAMLYDAIFGGLVPEFVVTDPVILTPISKSTKGTKFKS